MLNVGQCARFCGNGIIIGNVHNEGRVEIPITALHQVTGAMSSSHGPNRYRLIRISRHTDQPRHDSRYRRFLGRRRFRFRRGWQRRGGGTVTPGPTQIVDPCVNQVGGCGITSEGIPVADGSLEVTGYYEQTETGSTLMSVVGNHSADFDVSKTHEGG